LFAETGQRRDRAIELGLWALSAVTMVWFFRGGGFSWNQNTDWQKEWTYYVGWKQSLLRGVLPYYLRTSMQGTERFLANVETLVAPHVVLLRAMSITSFFLLHVLMFLSIGFHALVKLRRELDLSLFAWTAFIVLFLLNGHITSHLATGHTQWVSYLLLPWVLLCAVRLTRGDDSLANAMTLAAAFAAMIVIGGWHIFVWSTLLVTFVALQSPAHLLFLARVMAIVAPLAAFRLLPGVLTFGTGSNTFLGSFRHLSVLLDALVGDGPSSWLDGLDRWEYDTYVGYAGFVLICLGMLPVRTALNRSLNALLLPSFALGLLSMYNLYERTLFKLPGFVSERVVTRFAIVPVLTLSLLGCVRFDRWTRFAGRRLTVRNLCALLLSWGLAAQLILRAYGTRPAMHTIGPPLPTDVLKTVAVDAGYFWSFWSGVGVSIPAWAILLVALSRSHPCRAERL
jgi:hypothetical protein